MIYTYNKEVKEWIKIAIAVFKPKGLAILSTMVFENHYKRKNSKLRYGLVIIFES
jgi:hypothetical protein